MVLRVLLTGDDVDGRPRRARPAPVQLGVGRRPSVDPQRPRRRQRAPCRRRRRRRGGGGGGAAAGHVGDGGGPERTPACGAAEQRQEAAEDAGAGRRTVRRGLLLVDGRELPATRGRVAASVLARLHA